MSPIAVVVLPTWNACVVVLPSNVDSKVHWPDGASAGTVSVQYQ